MSNSIEYDKRGFYQVGNKKFYRKIDAITEHSKSGIHPHWNFNETAFSSYNWTQPVDISLNELYRMRAQQLRDKYDYLVLCFSGGIDSYTILRAFHDNNIFIDEILIFGPFKGTESTKSNSNEAWNLRSEVDFQALPMLKKLGVDSRTKVTMYDYTDDLLDYYANPNWIEDFNPGVRYNSSMPKNILLHNATRNYLQQYDAGRRVGFIHGIDKPRICYRDNAYYLYFLDVQLSISVGDFNQTNNHYWENDELFYWTPDLPELLAKQSQVICAWFEQNKDLRDKLDYKKFGALVPEHYYSIVNKLVYPYHADIGFSVKKPYNPMFQENEYWFRDQNIPAFSQWLNGLSDLEKQVPTSWCNGGDFKKGLIGCYSKFYKVGIGLDNL